MKKQNDIQSTQVHLDFSNQISLMYFSWELLCKYILKVAIYLLFFRLFFTFLFAFINSQQWFIKKSFFNVPIVAFNVNLDVFTKINSYSIFAVTLTIAVLFVFQIFSEHDSQKIYKVYAWYLGAIMAFIQYLVLIFINDLVLFPVFNDMWKVLVLILIITSSLLYFWKSYLFGKQIKKICGGDCGLDKLERLKYGE